MNRLLLFSLMMWAFTAHAQTTTSYSMEINNVRAETLNDGRFFTTGQTGGFHANSSGFHGALMRLAGLWAGGKSPDGTLHLSTSGSLLSEFTPGVFDPETGTPANLLQHKIWDVTKEEILAHQADFSDNGIIDNPLAGVFGWPGKGNPYFQSFNIGQLLPAPSNQDLAGFFDADGDGLYNPAKGEYPALEISGCPAVQIPDIMAWMAFNDQHDHLLSAAEPLKMEVQATMFTYQCWENSPMGNTVFLKLKLFYWGNEPLSDTYFGLLNDFQVGDGLHEFAGCDPSRKMLFGYNGLAVESAVPAVGVQFLSGPKSGNNTEMLLHSAIIIDPTPPLSQSGYYNLLSGKNPDGSIASYGGFTYPGNPVNSDDSTEISLGNVPGNRATVASFGPLLLEPGAVNEIVAAYSFATTTDMTGFSPNVKPLYSFSDRIGAFYDNCFEVQPEFELCTPEVLPVHTDATGDPGIQIYPNPASGSFFVSSQQSFLQRVKITDITGRITMDIAAPANVNGMSFQTATNPLIAGMYLVSVYTADQHLKTIKLVIER